MARSNVRFRTSENFRPLVSIGRLGVRSTNLSFNFPDFVIIETLDSKMDCRIALVKILSYVALTLNTNIRPDREGDFVGNEFRRFFLLVQGNENKCDRSAAGRLGRALGKLFRTTLSEYGMQR